MFQVHERDGEIIFTEKVSNKLRIFLSIIGFFPIIYVPYKLIIQPGWNEFSIYLFFSIVISIGAFLLGSLFLAAGLFGTLSYDIIRKI
ncbi:MAG: hypothetical protein NZ809_00835 [Thermodesulfovibrio sp.]|nr:hypothetical protein [Thermodesulfovibrio sp.]